LRLFGSWFVGLEYLLYRALDHLNLALADMRIDFGRLDALMAQQVLNVANINSSQFGRAQRERGGRWVPSIADVVGECR
jgi:hypothetical protein